MTNKPLTAPACFGAATVFSRDSDACQACSAFEACSVESMETLQKLRSVINVEDIIERHKQAKLRSVADASKPSMPVEVDKPIEPMKRFAKLEKAKSFTLAEHDDAIIATITAKKSKELSISLGKGGLLDAIRGGLKTGENALESKGPRFLRLALDLLMKGGFTRKELASAFEDQLGWSKGTALSHVSITLPFLFAFKFAQANGDRIVLTPEFISHN